MNRESMHWLAAAIFASACGAGTPATEVRGEEENEMMVIRVVVDVRPEHTEAFVAHLREEALQVRELDGCERYELFRDSEREHRFLLYEEWASREAFDAYRESDLLRESFAVLGPMMAGAPDSAYYAVLRPE